MLRHFELFLACRYLKKRRLAFFSVAAVALSVAMLIVVRSVTGGFVKQFRSSYHNSSGDIIIRAESLMGFPYYDELIGRARKLDGVVEATPVIKQFGLFRIEQTKFRFNDAGVEIFGIKPGEYSKITNFKQSLYNQKKHEAPATLEVPKKYYDTISGLKGGCIVGVELPYNRKSDGSFKREEDLYGSLISLTILPFKRSGALDVERVIYKFILIDDSETSVFSVDAQTVYIDFDVAQRMTRMGSYQDDDGRIEPARTSRVLVRTNGQVDLAGLCDQLKKIWGEIAAEKGYIGSSVVFETWDEQESISRVIAQFNRESNLMTTLFGIMGMVSVFLIFCIFFVIVTEKIPDIGIIKSVGGSGWGVGRIFFTYAGAVGVVGALLGLAMGWPFVVHINAIHDWVAQILGWRVYDASILLFPDIPNEVDWSAAVIIMIAAVAGSLVGSMIPAIRAATMKPIQALRYE